MRGRLITFEGIDACGKTTQADMLCAWLRQRGHEPLRTVEPGGTAVGLILRSILLGHEHPELCARAELLLYVADRAQHVEEVIRPALAAGKIVVSDRFAESSVAYQGHGRNLGAGAVELLNRFATQELAADLVIVLDISPDVALSRKRTSQPTLGHLDRIESADDGFRERVRGGYLTLAEREPQRVRIIDGERSVEEVHTEVVAVVAAVLLGGDSDPRHVLSGETPDSRALPCPSPISSVTMRQ